MTERTIAFGAFRLIPTRRLLLKSCAPVPIGSRALDILVALVERPGNLVTKDELFARVWPNTTVAERNLPVQVSAMRKAIGDADGPRRFVVTTPGRGYTFVAPVKILADPSHPAGHDRASGRITEAPCAEASG